MNQCYNQPNGFSHWQDFNLTPNILHDICKYGVIYERHTQTSGDFLSSAYVVSPGPTSRKFFFLFFCFSFFHSVSNFLGASLVKALASGSGSGIPHFRTLSPAIPELGWGMPHSVSSVFHPVSNFLGFQLVKALFSGSGSGKPLIQDIEPSNVRARLSHATLRFFSLAEQCHTQKFYLRCFNSDFDAVKSRFGLLNEYAKFPFYGIKIWLETPEIKMLSGALLSQAKQSECGMAQLSPCIAGFNVLDKRYRTWNTRGSSNVKFFPNSKKSKTS